MRKSGFSLAEVLITTAIVAISAAMLIPTYMNVKPDRYKLKVLNCYKALNKVTEDLISNPDLYFRTPIPEDVSDDWYTANNIYVNNTNILNPNTEWGCNGLACTQQTNLPNGHPFLDNNFTNSDYSDVCKYPNLLLQAMELSNIEKCSSSNRTASGISSNRISWEITPEGNNENQYWSGRTYRVMVDVDSKNNVNHSYDDSHTHPDQFVFRVDTGGDITGVDALTQQYLRNMTNIRKQDDIDAMSGD